MTAPSHTGFGPGPNYDISVIRRLVREFAEHREGEFAAWQAEMAVAQILGVSTERDKYVYRTRLGGQVKRSLDELSGEGKPLRREMRGASLNAGTRQAFYRSRAEWEAEQAEAADRQQRAAEAAAGLRDAWAQVNATLAREGFLTLGSHAVAPEFDLDGWQRIAAALSTTTVPWDREET